MHIGMDARLTYYRRGGISTYIRRLVEALERLDTENRYTVFHSRKAHESLVTSFRHATLWTPAHHRMERLALSAELLPFNLDVLHSPDFIPPLRGARRHIITVHDLTFLHYPEFLTAESRRYYNGQIHRAVRQADHILADSESTRNDIVTMLTVHPAKVTVHMLGIDERFKPLPTETLEACREELALPEQYILFVGTFEPRKNIRGLLDAYQMLLPKLPELPPLVLAGQRGWLFDETMSYIDSLRLGNRVLWRENVPQQALPALYNMASLLVMPSFYEGFGFPALEAMSCGVVPVVSNRSSLPEVVGDVGLQVNPDDPATIANAIEYALTHPEWVDRMRREGLQRAATFTWERTAALVLSVYCSL